jgi:hypothetical protein
VRLERLGQLKKSNDLIGTRTPDLPAGSAVPQLTTLPRAGTVAFALYHTDSEHFPALYYFSVINIIVIK